MRDIFINLLDNLLDMIQGSKTFCRLLKKQIADEKHAKEEYDKLKKHAPSRSIKLAIGRVGSQESKHRVKLTRMYWNHCTS